MGEKEGASKMNMSHTEIVNSYKQAKYPEKQIGILAELNAVQPSVILGILSDAGIPVNVKKRKTQRKLDYSQVYSLSNEGKGVRAISRITGIPYSSVRNILQRQEQEVDVLTPNTGEESLPCEDVSVPEKASEGLEKPQGQKYSKLDHDLIFRLADEGKSAKEIAEITGYLYKSVWSALNTRPQSARTGQGYSKLDHDWIHRLADEGKSAKEIAEITGYAYGSVRGVLNARKKRQSDNATPEVVQATSDITPTQSPDVVQATPPSAKTLLEYVAEYTELKAVIAEHKERLKQLHEIILNELENDELG